MRLLIWFGASVAAACATHPRVVSTFNPACRSLEDVSTIAATKHEALREMKSRVLAVGGNTLLFGEEGLVQLHIHESRAAFEKQQLVNTGDERNDTVIDTPISTAYRTPPGKTMFYGAALLCERQ